MIFSEASDAPFPPVHLDLIAQFLPMSELQSLRTSGQSVSGDAEQHLKTRSEAFLLKTVPDDAARAHYQELFGTCEVERLLDMRKWLAAVDGATQFGQWRTQTAVARLMTGVALDGRDLFAAVKRAFLASQVPRLAASPQVGRGSWERERGFPLFCYRKDHFHCFWVSCVCLGVCVCVSKMVVFRVVSFYNH